MSTYFSQSWSKTHEVVNINSTTEDLISGCAAVSGTKSHFLNSWSVSCRYVTGTGTPTIPVISMRLCVVSFAIVGDAVESLDTDMATTLGGSIGTDSGGYTVVNTLEHFNIRPGQIVYREYSGRSGRHPKLEVGGDKLGLLAACSENGPQYALKFTWTGSRALG